ncbi:ABC transporter permease subunit [Spirulina sp. CS-785/01]|uniref:ABC transporter permease n=1 Tax=Spirulina sp. CS-785/01 TaxID=3021716 RepID=UPI00232FBE11|nr:ABC transporter permease subunit [Spirulina sp. CS-785/01]MDB9314390.1 ABC transporter permease subunit [Spirulina sp. CS-785/01]
MLITLISIEFQKLRSRNLFLILSGLIIAVLLLLFIGGFLSYQVVTKPDSKKILQDSLTWANGGNLALSITSGLGSFFLLVLTAAATVSDYNWRTLHLSLSHGVSREQLFWGKFFAFVLTAVLFVLVPFFLAFLLMLPLTPLMGGEFSASEFTTVLSRVPRVFLYLLTFVTFAFFLGIVTRSLALSLVFGLLYIFVVEPVLMTATQFIGEPWVQVADYLPFQLATALLRITPDMPMMAELEQQFVSPAIAALGVLLWGTIFLGLGLLRFRQQDLL